MSNLTPRINRLESNLVIDGAMEIWPEGTSRTVASGAAAYGSVLFRCENSASSVTVTNSRQTAIPANTNLQFSNEISKTAAGTLTASTLIQSRYVIEGYDLDRILKQEFTIIFWVKSSVASNRSVSIRNGASTHSIVKQYNINAANTWELKALRFPSMDTCPGALERTNGIGALIRFPIVSGSSFQTSTLNSWLSGNFVSGVGEDTTWLTGTTHDFSIAGVMVLPGNWEGLTAAQYNFVRAGRNFEDEVAMSQRYFEKSYSLADAPGTTTVSGSEFFWAPTTFTNADLRNVNYKVSKRVPGHSVSYYSVATGVINRVRNSSAAADRVGYVAFVSENGYVQGYNDGSGLTTGQLALWHWVADARF